MHTISFKPFREAMSKFPNKAVALNDTYKKLTKGDFKNSQEMKKVFSSLDNFKYVNKWWVIDIGGNDLRLIIAIEFAYGKVFVKGIFTHSEYEKFCDNHR